MSDGVERDRVGRALDCQPGEPLAEDAFRQLLSIERARADRAGRPLWLLAISLNHGSRQAPFAPAVAGKLFAGLGEAVRETDIVGWYRQDRVAAAVLMEGAGTTHGEVASGILQRVGEALDERLSSRVVRQLRVRVVKVRQQPRNR